MNRRFSWTRVLVLGMALGAGGPALAQGMGPGMGMMQGSGMGMGPMMDGDMPCGSMGMHPGWMAGAQGPLTEQQQQALSALQQELHAAHWEQMQEMHKLQADQMRSGAPQDKAAILELHRKMSDIHLKMLELRLDAQEKMNEILKPQ